MKKIALISAALVIASASAALAAPMTILNSRHDMRSVNGETSTNAEVCIYCHTPHNAKINVPLWNRNNPSVTWTLYNTSATLSSAATNSSISSDSISLFCMSCHDGQTAIGDLKNKNPLLNAPGDAGVTGTTAKVGSRPGAPGAAVYAVIGGSGGHDLSSTHPIGFNFVLAQGEDSGLNDKDAILQTFKDKADGKTTAQNFLYNRPSATGTGQVWFECASCHRVHDPGLSGNFLRIENQASQLCLACHNK